MPDDASKRSQFQWDEGDQELELRGKGRRRFSPWKVFLPGFVVMAAAVAVGGFVSSARVPAEVVLALASAFQVFLCLAYASRRTEVEYMWPLEQHVRFGDESGGTYREKARRATVDLDGLQVGTREVREVQVRAIVKPEASASEEESEVFLVLEHRVILVERSVDRASLVQYAAELRQLFGVEEDSGRSRPITESPTQTAGIGLMIPVVIAPAVGLSVHYLPPFVDRLVLLTAAALLVVLLCVASFRIYRASLRKASRLWVKQEFGIEPLLAARDGSTEAR